MMFFDYEDGDFIHTISKQKISWENYYEKDHSCVIYTTHVFVVWVLGSADKQH